MIELEDFYEDIIGKAQRGLQLSDLDLITKAGITQKDLNEAKSGLFKETVAEKLASALQLSPSALIASGKKAWHPHLLSDSLPSGLKQFTTSYGDMLVNAYLIWDPKTKESAVFDTGETASPLLEFIKENALDLKLIFLTHSHGDHINDLPKLQKHNSSPTYIHQNGDIGSVQLFDYGKTFSLGSLSISTRQTTGHASDGTTYVIEGLEQPIAIVGDALFAGSMGGGMVNYQEALQTNRKNIFTLPDETLICPGHGPISSVQLEKAHNPFYPEYQKIAEH